MKTNVLMRWPDGTEEHQKEHALRHVKILDVAIRACGDRRRTAVQAGGNVGLWPIKLAAHFKKIITFEPEPISFACLKQNVRHLKQVECRQEALGAIGQMCGIERRSLGSHRICQGFDIKMIRLDSLELTDVDLLQLDIEGGEYPALLGAEKTIRKSRPIIMLEFLSKDAENCCTEWLKAKSYRCTTTLGRDFIFEPR